MLRYCRSVYLKKLWKITESLQSEQLTDQTSFVVSLTTLFSQKTDRMVTE
jgi:hypothetical protein